jgi:hypothetical protein
MGFESRGSNSYYYRKQRVGGRVVSRYVGGGDVGRLSAKLDAADRAEEEARRARDRGEHEAEEALDELLDALGSALRMAAACELIAAGCHSHNGQWRVIRGGKA